MEKIKDFSLLSKDELKAFAAKILEQVNASQVFIDGEKFTPDFGQMTIDKLTGDLEFVVCLGDTEKLTVTVDTEWSCDLDCEDLGRPSERDIDIDLKYEKQDEILESALKAKEAVIDGYQVSIATSELEKREVIDVDVTDSYPDDSGIGEYEFWGATGYDSHPYTHVEGKATVACDGYYWIVVEPCLD